MSKITGSNIARTRVNDEIKGAGNGKSRLKSSGAIGDTEITLQPSEVEIELYPRTTDTLKAHLSSYWHTVQAPSGLTVRITSSEDRVTIYQCSVQGSTHGSAHNWSAGWPKWLAAKRAAPELAGGSSVDAQDKLSDDGTVLTLLVLPGETREAVLEFAVCLDGETYPGTYGFKVVVSDVEREEKCELDAELILKHPTPALLEMLPALYREPYKGGPNGDMPFFHRFLRGFQDFLDPLRSTLDQVPNVFGAFNAPPDFLPWLSSWVALVLDENWPEMKRRKLISEAVELYRWRGTRKGLSRFLEIYTGVEPDINDQPLKGMRLGPDAILGKNTMLGDIPDHTFVVTIAVPDPGAVKEQIVRDIINAEKPAHTAYSLRIVRC